MSVTERHSRVPAAVCAAALAALTVFLLRRLLDPGFDRLPGTDAGNLYAWEMFTRAAFAAGQLPFWNPHAFGGAPHLADTQTTVLYPPALILRAVLPRLQYLPVMAALHLWWAGVGTLRLARGVGLRWPSSLAAAIAVMLGGSAAPWLHNGHLLLLFCSAWVPWALALSMRDAAVVSDPHGGPGVRVLPSPALVSVLVLQFLAGYVQGSIYLVAMVCVVFVFAALWPTDRSARLRPLVQLAWLGVITAGVAAFQLLPMGRVAGEAARSTGIPYSAAVAAAWHLPDLASFLFADPGASDRSAYVGWLLVCFAPAAWLDHSRRRLVVLFAVLIGAALALTSDVFGLYRLHYAVFPGFRVPGRILIIATPALAVCGAIGLERIVTLLEAREWRPLGMAAAAAGAIVIASVVVAQATDPTAMARWQMLGIAAAAGAAGLLVLGGFRMTGVALTVAALAVACDVGPRLASVLTAEPTPQPESLRASFGPPDGGRILSACDSKVNGADFVMGGFPTVTGMGGVTLRGFAALNDRMAGSGPLEERRDLWDATNLTRVVTCAPTTLPNLSLVALRPPFLIYRNDTAWPRAIWTCGLEQLTEWETSERLREGHYEGRRLVREQRVNIRWRASLAAADRQRLEARYGLSDGELREGTTWRYRILDTSRANVTALLDDPAVEDTHGVDRDHGQVAPPTEAGAARDQMLLGTTRCAGDGTVAVLETDRPDGLVRARVSAPADGFVVFAEAYFPERHAYVDGKRVTTWRTNLAFIGVPVPAGAHELEIRYVPVTLYAGLGTGLLTLLFWGGGVHTFNRRRRGPASAE